MRRRCSGIQLTQACRDAREHVDRRDLTTFGRKSECDYVYAGNPAPQCSHSHTPDFACSQAMEPNVSRPETVIAYRPFHALTKIRSRRTSSAITWRAFHRVKPADISIWRRDSIPPQFNTRSTRICSTRRVPSFAVRIVCSALSQDISLLWFLATISMPCTNSVCAEVNPGSTVFVGGERWHFHTTEG